MAIKCTKFFYFKSLLNFPNWYFGFQNIPSGNPARVENSGSRYFKINSEKIRPGKWVYFPRADSGEFAWIGQNTCLPVM
jgi:hypothetical protein